MTIPPPERPLPRRGMLGGGAGLLAALAGCVPPEAELELVDSPPPAPPEPAEQVTALPAPAAESPLAALRDGADPVIDGQALDGALLRPFYAARDFEPMWESQPRLAEALTAAVLRAGDHGLHPDLFAGAALRRLAQFAPQERECLLSHAVLTFAQALAMGAVSPNQRRHAEALTPGPVDAAAALHAALDTEDPVAAIERLAPRSATYQALRQALRQDRLPPARLRLLTVNLERQRWLPRQLPADRVWVDITGQSLVLFRADRPVFSTRVVVGAPLPPMQSPELHTEITGAVLNPPWVIPEDIFRRSILPRLEQDPAYLARRNITLTEDGEAEQAAGPDSALGAIMFDMPNRFDVYLHDTPDRAIFSRPDRRISNGCIRVENPLQLAALVMDKPLAEIEAKVAARDTREEEMARPMPVFLVYQTMFLAGRGLQARPDIYGRDAGLWQALQPRGA